MNPAPKTRTPSRRLSPPAVGRTVPGWAVLLAFTAVGVGASAAALPHLGWFAVGAALTLLGVLLRRAMAPWLLIVLIGGAMVWQMPDAANWRYYAVLAGVHLLHLLGSLLPWVTLFARVQPAVFAPMARRFVLIQVPVQVAGWLVLSFAGSGVSASAGVFGVLAGLALAALALVILVPLFRERHRRP